MEDSSFHQRFRNRSQFVSKEGSIVLGTCSVSKKEISMSKLHRTSEKFSKTNQNLNYSMINESSEPIFPKNVNKSFSSIKLPKINNVKSKAYGSRERGLGIEKETAQPLSYAKKKMNSYAVLRDTYLKGPRTDFFQRNVSLVLRAV